MQMKLINTSALSWMTCAFAGGAGWIVSLVLPHLFGGFVKFMISAGGVMIAAALFGYLQPRQPWRWAVASIVIPFMITAMRSESWLYVGVNMAIGFPLLLLSLGSAYSAAFIKEKRHPSHTVKPIPTERRLWWLVAALASIPWIFQINFPVSTSSTQTAIVTTGGIIFLISLAFSLWKPERVWRWALALTFGFITIIVVRIVFEGILNPASHNLWPFEILLAGTVAAPSSFLGAYAAILLTWLWSQRSRNNRDDG